MSVDQRLARYELTSWLLPNLIGCNGRMEIKNVSETFCESCLSEDSLWWIWWRLDKVCGSWKLFKAFDLIQYGGHVDLVAMECHVRFFCHAKFGFKVFWLNPIWRPDRLSCHDRFSCPILGISSLEDITRHNNHFYKANTWEVIRKNMFLLTTAPPVVK